MSGMSRYISSKYYISLIFSLIFLLLSPQGFTADISVLRNQILNVCPKNNLTGRECAAATQKAVHKLPDDKLLLLLKNIGVTRFQLQAKTQSDIHTLKQTKLRPAQYSQLDQPLHPVRNQQIDPINGLPYPFPINSRLISQGVSEGSQSPHSKLPLQHRPNNQSISATKSVNNATVETRYKSDVQQHQQQLKEALRSPQSRDHLVRIATNYLLNTASIKQYSHNK